jgi:hypothetical protein
MLYHEHHHLESRRAHLLSMITTGPCFRTPETPSPAESSDPLTFRSRTRSSLWGSLDHEWRGVSRSQKTAEKDDRTPLKCTSSSGRVSSESVSSMLRHLRLSLPSIHIHSRFRTGSSSGDLSPGFPILHLCSRLQERNFPHLALTLPRSLKSTTTSLCMKHSTVYPSTTERMPANHLGQIRAQIEREG